MYSATCSLESASTMVHRERSSSWSTRKTEFVLNMTPCCGGYTGFGLQPFTQPRSPSGVKTRSALSALASSSNDPSRTTCLVVILLSGNLVCDAETITTPPTANNIAIQFIAPPKEKPPGPMRRQAVHLPKKFGRTMSGLAEPRIFATAEQVKHSHRHATPASRATLPQSVMEGLPNTRELA